VYAHDLLKDRVIVVTGGGSGLGAEMARRFADLGAHPVVLGRTKEKLDRVVAQIGRGTAIACDVRDAAAVAAAAATGRRARRLSGAGGRRTTYTSTPSSIARRAP
jgi:NAD(P)-dependent dehydrogenase (short-subunit alcohol dehydrogenase family)